MGLTLRAAVDAIPAAGFALTAGGGTAFFVFARMTFDRVPIFSQHPRFDAGEIVGPLVSVVNGTEIAVALVVLAAAAAARRTSFPVVLLAAAILTIALAERLFLLPEIVTLREQLGRSGFDGDAMSPLRRRFGLLHGIDNGVQLLCVLLAWAGLFVDRQLLKSAAPSS